MQSIALTKKLDGAIQLYASGNLQDAEVQLREILAVERDSGHANTYLGLIAMRTNRHEMSIPLLRKGIEEGIASAAVLLAMGVSLTVLGRRDEAGIYYRKAIMLQPAFAEAYYNYGKCLQEDGKPGSSIKHYLLAIKHREDLIEAYCNLGLAYIETHQLEKAVNILEKAIVLRPDHPLSHYNLAVALLALGELEKGWMEYEWRLQHPYGRVRALPFDTWQGQSLKNSSLLVYAEQGVGDEVMFASCLANLIDMETGPISLECDPRLAPLFARTFPQIDVIGNQKDIETDWQGRFPDIDLKVAIASLPRFFRKDSKDFLNGTPYLALDSVKVDRWKRRLSALGNQPKVGLSWRGGLREKAQKLRTTQLTDWVPVLEKEAIFINLQYGDCRTELASLKSGFGLHIEDWEDADPLADLDDFCAQVAALDLVISIDNSTVHFAGASGTPVWNLLPAQPEFRWMLERQDTPWYPGMRLFRQSRPGEWSPLLQQVADSLAVFLRGSKAGQ